MHELAQTNLQLYAQLIDLGWPEADLAAARAAYQLAAELFTGRYRPSGKTFVAHLVGTASCLAAVDGRPSLVAAGLLHAAHEAGDFGPRVGLDGRRAMLRARAGAEVDELVFAYWTLSWKVATIRSLSEAPAELSPTTRDVVLMRLANEVDEHVDNGVRIADRNDAPIYQHDAVDSMCRLARLLGNDRLAELLEQLSDSSAPASPAVLRSDVSDSVLVPPASTRPAFLVTASAGGRRLRREVRRIPGARRLVGAVRRARRQ